MNAADAVLCLASASPRRLELLASLGVPVIVRPCDIDETPQPAEAAAYWHTGEPRDKAGGYALQGYAAAFVSDIHGSYSAVVGLPLYETAALLRRQGVALWHGAIP